MLGIKIKTNTFIILRKTNWSSAKFFLSLLVLCSLFIASACKQGQTTGLEVQPKQDKFALTINTATKIVSRSVLESSLRSDETSQNLVGSYNDPVFGTHSAATLTQVLLSSNAPDFGSSPVLDSVTLSVAMKKFYGEISSSTGKQRFQVYSLNTDIYKESPYYSSLTPSNYYSASNLLADTTLLPDFLTSNTASNGEAIPPLLKLKLNKEQFQSFLNSSNAGYFASNTDFVSFFKGLCIKTNNPAQAAGTGAIVYLDLLNSNTKLTLHFHNAASNYKSFELLINTSCARINTFTHDYSSATEIRKQVGETTLGFETAYIQSMAGLKMKLSMPFLAAWRDSLPMAISKAEIVFTAAPGTLTNYNSPVKLQLVALDSAGVAFNTDDELLESSDYFGGFFTTASSSYTFNITRHFQQILNGTRKDYGYYLQCIGGTNTADRLVLQSGSGIVLKLTYTKL